MPTERVKKNSTAQAGCKLFLTKPLGIGVLTTAEKKSLLKPEHQGLATEVMCRMNIAGAAFANIDGVKAMTDVTGFWPAGAPERDVPGRRRAGAALLSGHP